MMRLVYGLGVYEHIADRFSWRRDDGYSKLGDTIVTCGKLAFSETGRPTMKRLPVHPLFLAGVYAVFGKSLVAVQILQSLLCAITCVLIYCTARKVSNEQVANVAALIFAFYPNSILYSARTLSETTYTFLLAVFCLTLVRQFKKPTVWASIATGLSFGLLMLTKSTTVLLPLFLFLTLLSAHYRKRLWRVVSSIVLTVFVAALVMSPWAIRNYRLTGKIIVFSTFGGAPFYRGYYLATHLGDGRSSAQLEHDGAQEGARLVSERYTPSGQPIDEYHQDRIAYSLVWEKIRTRPLYSAGIFLRGVFLVWFLTFGSVTTVMSLLVHTPLLLLAVYAILVMLRQDHSTGTRMLPLVLTCAYFNLFHAVVYPHVRYIAPAIGTIVTILAAYSISHLVPLVRSSRMA
jgi:4-amino-4-deoxy-L-arabinose transferase-like glycosyltransferase